MEATMAREAQITWYMIMGFAIFINRIHVYSSESYPTSHFSGGHKYGDHMRRMQEFKAFISSPSLSSSLPSQGKPSPCVYFVTSYGADPTGKTDSTEALLRAISDAFHGPSEGFMIEGISNLGGAQVNLEGGNYKISRPLRFPAAGVGNVMIHGGTLHASEDFPIDGYLIDFSSSSSANNEENKGRYNYEYITLKDLMLDCNYKGGAISIINSLRVSVDNCYITHFTTNGILVQSGHETYIRNSFLGQHITAGGHPGERNFSGTGINLTGNDNAVTDVVIFSASIGIMVSGQANTLTGVHCYNKATGLGGTGIYLKLPGLTQTRIVNSYLDYNGIIAEDPVLLHVSNSFFLGDAYITLKSVNGIVNGVNIVDNMFTGFNKGIGIVQLDQSNGGFKEINQVVVDRNHVRGMSVRSTVARRVVRGNGRSWVVDFNPVLLFPNLIRHVQYSLRENGNSFPNHVLRNVSENRIVIESDLVVSASVFVTVDQGTTS